MGTDGKAVSLWCDWTVQAKGGSWGRGRSRRWACPVDRAENLGSHCEHEKGVSFSFLGPLRQMNTVGPKQSVIRKRGWEEQGDREQGGWVSRQREDRASCQGTRPLHLPTKEMVPTLWRPTMNCGFHITQICGLRRSSPKPQEQLSQLKPCSDVSGAKWRCLPLPAEADGA